MVNWFLIVKYIVINLSDILSLHRIGIFLPVVYYSIIAPISSLRNCTCLGNMHARAKGETIEARRRTTTVLSRADAAEVLDQLNLASPRPHIDQSWSFSPAGILYHGMLF